MIFGTRAFTIFTIRTTESQPPALADTKTIPQLSGRYCSPILNSNRFTIHFVPLTQTAQPYVIGDQLHTVCSYSARRRYTDVLLYRDGELDRSQLEVLKSLRKQLKDLAKERVNYNVGNFSRPIFLLKKHSMPYFSKTGF
jgi:hypothetical protein